MDTQARVSQYVMSKTKAPGSSHSKNGNDMETFDSSEYEFNISASLMSKILEDSIQDTVTKHCDTCSCSNLQSQPFCYNESHYSVATQTALSGEMKNSLCLNCNTDIKAAYSGLSVRSVSPHGVKLINEKSAPHVLPGPLYIIPQPVSGGVEGTKSSLEKESEKVLKKDDSLNDIKIEENLKYEVHVPKEISKIGEEMKQIRKNNAVNMEPAVHHKLCDRTKTPISSMKNNTSLGNEDTLMKDLSNPTKDTKAITENQMIDNISLRKNSLSSMGAMSRTSSLAKSTASTHKSNTQVGPGPRFCSLRIHPGSKNILLDNAQPDVPPVLYRRQSKCNENNIFKEVEGGDNYVNLAKKDENTEIDSKHDNVVVESTLIDVHVDNNNKETSAASKTSSINPILMNVSSSPLQPLKTHNFSNDSEKNNNPRLSITSQTNTSEVDNILNGFNPIGSNPANDIDSKTKDDQGNVAANKPDLLTPTDNHEVKIFNFDRYEQSKLSSQYPRPMRMIDMSNLHSLENTKISKDLPPQGELPKIVKKEMLPAKNLSTIVNVYPNLTQTHLKANDNKKVFTNEQSTSSLSSDDSAAILQKQQLLRVAEWVEQNLEQQNNLNDPLEEDVSFNTKLARRESRINRLTDTLNELALNMPHPVSKYSKSYTRDDHKHWVHSNPEAHRSNQSMSRNTTKVPVVNNVAKETEFPIEGDEPNTETSNTQASEAHVFENISKNLSEALKNGDREISAEELARMEYNVKKFLLSGPQWANPESVGRSRRTSSKTETDV